MFSLNLFQRFQHSLAIGQGHGAGECAVKGLPYAAVAWFQKTRLQQPNDNRDQVRSMPLQGDSDPFQGVFLNRPLSHASQPSGHVSNRKPKSSQEK